MTIEAQPKTIRLGSLLLDPKNTRIPAERRSDNQRQLLHELLYHEDVKGLAASIAKLGLFPNERLVVVPSGRRFIVIEGNRRLAAIKLLFSPELAPSDASVKYFRKHSAKADLSVLGKLEVIVVKSRLAAAPIIAAIHTSAPKKRWLSLQQARFYRELLDQGLTPVEVADTVGVTLGQVNNFLRTEKLYRIALTLEYSPDVRRNIEDSKFPLTTLARFIEFKEGRKLLGIKTDGNAGFTGIVHPDRFKAVLAKVAEDVATLKGLTRRINKDEEFKVYSKEIEPALAKTKIRGNFHPDIMLGLGDKGLDEDRNASSSEKPKVARQPKPSASIVPRGFSCTTRNHRVRDIFNELKAMKIEQQRNSSVVMLRVLIDIALWNYIKDEGHENQVCDHCDKSNSKRKYNKFWTPPLRDLISYAVEKQLFRGMNAAGYKSARSLASKDTDYFTTLEGFNSFTHNPYTTPTTSDLRALWQRAEPMLEIILN